MNRSVAIVISACVLALAGIAAMVIYVTHIPQPRPVSTPPSAPPVIIEREVPGPERRIYVPVPAYPTYPAITTGNWFVIAGSLGTQGEAQSRVNRLKSSGFANAVVDYSSNYPNFRPGYWLACAERFVSKSSAEDICSRIKSAGFDAYIKSAY